MRLEYKRGKRLRVNGFTGSFKEVTGSLMRGVFHYTVGSLAFRSGEQHWYKAERHLILARYYLTRPDGELESMGLQWYLTCIVSCRRKIRVGCAEKTARKLGAINRRAMERDEDRRRQVQDLPGLFESEMRELNIPLFLTYPD